MALVAKNDWLEAAASLYQVGSWQRQMKPSCMTDMLGQSRGLLIVRACAQRHGDYDVAPWPYPRP